LNIYFLSGNHDKSNANPEVKTEANINIYSHLVSMLIAAIEDNNTMPTIAISWRIDASCDVVFLYNWIIKLAAKVIQAMYTERRNILELFDHTNNGVR
jgi:3',5'-cyclic AMP phosphodiesterase CpdA